MSNASPVKVAVTGAAGQIGYALLFRIASGQLLGPDTPIALRLLEVPQAIKAAEGTTLELTDCAFGLLASVDIFDDPAQAFDGVNIALLVGARPRADEQRDVHPIERLRRIVEDVDRSQQTERAVGELERGALRGLDRLRNFEQPQRDRGVGAEQLTGCDPEQQRVSDLAGGAGDGHLDGRSVAHAFISSITASANSLVPTAVGSSRVGLRSYVTFSPLRITAAIASSSARAASCSSRWSSM